MATTRTRLPDRARLVWHIAGSLKDFWSSDLNRGVVDLINPQVGEVVLDLGAGLGPASVAAAPRVGPDGRVIAVDPSRAMRGILRLRCRTQRDLRTIEVCAGTAESLPVKPSSIDVLCAVNATHHFADLDRFTAELTRVLRPGGRVVLMEEDMSHPDHPFAMIAGEGQHGEGQHGEGQHGPHSIDVDALLTRFTAAGLRDAASAYRTVAGTPGTVITARQLARRPT